MIGNSISHYKIIEKIGGGGMGIVYKAQDLKLDRFVALKFLPPHLTNSEDEKQRFIHEAKAASALQHNNICAIHEIDETEDRQIFICMDYYEGETLDKRIKEKPLPIENAIEIAVQIATGLTKAHEKEIVHRDIKPANIMLTADGVVKVLDFGLAKLSTQTKLTKESTTLGTVSYMSPEQAKGEGVDHRTDIWSVGVVLYEMVAGEPPFKSDYDQAIVYSILNEEPKAVAELNKNTPSELQPIINKCLQKDRQLRYQKVQDLIADLKNITSNSKENVFSEPFEQKGRRKKIVTFVYSALFVMILAVILNYFVIQPMRQTESESKRITLVVLPFENLGEADHTYFTEGITDEITGRLGTVASISVISRNSAEHYAGKTWNTKQVGEDLNVEYIVAGTVRWATSSEKIDRVRITPRLIHVSDDTERWAESYDRVIDDVFDIQSEIALKVVQQLGITLGQTEQKNVEARPTKNLEAYQAYLQGQYYARSPHFTVDNWLRVIESYERAAELDPQFAVAHAQLASAHARLRFLRHDLSKERLQKAEMAAQKAEELAPESEEVLLALGYYHLWAHREINQAMKSWTQAEQIIPDDPRILVAKSNVYETQGNWDKAIGAIEKAIKFSPRDASMHTSLALYFWLKRDYSHAIELCNQAISLAPNENWPYLYKAFALWSWKGANEESKHAIEAVHPDYHWLPWAWFWQDVGERQFTRALNRLAVYDSDWIRNKMWAMPKSMMQGMLYDYIGNEDSALSKYQEALVLIKTEVTKWPEDPRYHCSLGFVLARLGRHDEALDEGNKAIELLPISKDAEYGIPYAENLAQIYVLIGEEDSAMDQIEMLFNIPSWMSVNWLKINPLYGQLNYNSRFQKIIKKYGQKIE
jgi:serine/threonine protein kinase/tetratricopeptide (TPR) repeat protein